MSIAQKVERAIRAVCPNITGVSLGVIGDKATWRVDFTAEATQEQREGAQAAIDAFDVAREIHNSDIDAQIAALESAAGNYNRGVREFMLGMAVIVKSLNGPDVSVTPGMVKVRALDDQIKALRAQRMP